MTRRGRRDKSGPVERDWEEEAQTVRQRYRGRSREKRSQEERGVKRKEEGRQEKSGPAKYEREEEGPKRGAQLAGRRGQSVRSGSDLRRGSVREEE